MRYQDWDVLLFPGASKIPLQEFKTTCHVIQDQEFFNATNGMLMIPTVVTFVPALQAGEKFRVSIHSWDTPKPSRYLQEYSQYLDSAIWEARVFIDGRLVTSHLINRDGPWPVILNNSIGQTLFQPSTEEILTVRTTEPNKYGEEEPLVFPKFHSEILESPYWSPADDLGRIKIVISEGFPRASETMRFERVKPLVSFSFQHAPLELLEASSIAWPNINMWRTHNLNWFASQSQNTPSIRSSELEDMHGHSPRCRVNTLVAPLPSVALGSSSITTRKNDHTEGHQDPYSFVGGSISTDSQWYDARKTSSTDDSMPDYSSCTMSHHSNSRKVSDQLGMQHKRHTNMQTPGAFEYVSAALLPAEPIKTPLDVDPQDTNLNSCTHLGISIDYNDASSHRLPSSHDGSTWAEVAQMRKSSSTTDPVKQDPVCNNPTPIIKSRKENLSESPIRAVEEAAFPQESHRVPGQTIGTNSSVKRRRVGTPASSKVIDKEDEPRSSPLARKGSEMRALSNVSNIF